MTCPWTVPKAAEIANKLLNRIVTMAYDGCTQLGGQPAVAVHASQRLFIYRDDGKERIAQPRCGK